MIEIIQGEKKEFVIVIEAETGQRLDLSPYDQYKVCFANFEVTETASANGSIVTKNGSDDLGELLVTINPADTETLSTGSNQDIYIELSSSTNPNDIDRYNIEDEITVKRFPC